MTVERAREEIPDFKAFAHAVCTCGCGHDWYCPTYCDTLEKAEQMDFVRILKSYARNDGDLDKVCRYIKRAKGGKKE